MGYDQPSAFMTIVNALALCRLLGHESVPMFKNLCKLVNDHLWQEWKRDTAPPVGGFLSYIERYCSPELALLVYMSHGTSRLVDESIVLVSRGFNVALEPEGVKVLGRRAG